jgi:hypothetical protein
MLLSLGQRAAAPRVLRAPKLASGGGDCSPNSWRPSIAARIGGEPSSRTHRVLDFAVKILGSTGDYL